MILPLRDFYDAITTIPNKTQKISPAGAKRINNKADVDT